MKLLKEKENMDLDAYGPEKLTLFLELAWMAKFIFMICATVTSNFASLKENSLGPALTFI